MFKLTVKIKATYTLENVEEIKEDTYFTIGDAWTSARAELRNQMGHEVDRLTMGYMFAMGDYGMTGVTPAVRLGNNTFIEFTVTNIQR